jgi:DNA polymerase-3 subunit epsilon
VENLNSTHTPTAPSKDKHANGLKLRRPIAVIDLETTGTSVEADRKRVRPGIKIPKEATRVHGITNEHVADKPSFKKIARDVSKFVRGCDLVGFNLKAFLSSHAQTDVN